MVGNRVLVHIPRIGVNQIIGNYPFLGLLLTILVFLQVFLLAGIAGRKLDTRSIKDGLGQSYAIRERNASFFYSVVIIGIMSVAAGYAMSLAASWTLEFSGARTGADVNPGVLAAVGIVVVVEIILVIVAIIHEREIVLSPADLRVELSQLKSQGEGGRYGSAPLADLKSRLERLQRDNVQLRTRRKLSTDFKERYESLFSYHEEINRGQSIVVLERKRQDFASWLKCLFYFHGFMLGRLRVFTAIALGLLFLGTVISSARLSTVDETGSFLIVILVIIVTYMIDSKNALVKLAKGQVLLQAQIAICDRLVADLDLGSAGASNVVSYKIGKWNISRVAQS
ncbi:hypothetical protein [Arthrobacter sunyaminii]|uniref:hypothetical protein n=1 Tax=Arthrobacter sunyaminii TaxID=2816859 RepID=UPI001A94475B|nr:hypothetical protein [Arthrobacter sunyaminii]MBO0895194.1 hypothetical protein [Arthrobacter sunyaminii]